MKILIVCSGNTGEASPFVQDQVQALVLENIEIKYFLINGKGVLGYLTHLPAFKKKIKQDQPDIIHAHYGLSGLFANLQRKIPVITTFHGSDIHQTKNRKFSRLAHLLNTNSIFVSQKLKNLIRAKKGEIIPCGINLNVFFEMDKTKAKRKMNLNENMKYVLFASGFDISIKNYPLAKKAIELLKNPNISLLELKGYNRKQVNILLNAVDVALLTSYNEGSPQFIKEAMATNTPIVATAVGDVKELVGDIEGCFITDFTPEDVADKIQQAVQFSKEKGKTNAREKIKNYDNKEIAKKINEIYHNILH